MRTRSNRAGAYLVQFGRCRLALLLAALPTLSFAAAVLLIRNEMVEYDDPRLGAIIYYSSRVVSSIYDCIGLRSVIFANERYLWEGWMDFFVLLAGIYLHWLLVALSVVIVAQGAFSRWRDIQRGNRLV